MTNAAETKEMSCDCDSHEGIAHVTAINIMQCFRKLSLKTLRKLAEKRAVQFLPSEEKGRSFIYD